MLRHDVRILGAFSHHVKANWLRYGPLPIIVLRLLVIHLCFILLIDLLLNLGVANRLLLLLVRVKLHVRYLLLWLSILGDLWLLLQKTQFLLRVSKTAKPLRLCAWTLLKVLITVDCSEYQRMVIYFTFRMAIKAIFFGKTPTENPSLNLCRSFLLFSSARIIILGCRCHHFLLLFLVVLAQLRLVFEEAIGCERIPSEMFLIMSPHTHGLVINLTLFFCLESTHIQSIFSENCLDNRVFLSKVKRFCIWS